MDLYYPTGYMPQRSGPLARFLPPLEHGSTSRTLEGFGSPGDFVLDPFGASPRLVLEAAQSGRAVLVTANNPVVRFVLLHTVAPFSRAELQTALARLAAAPKDDSRMEPFILDLYRTECARCGAPIIAEFFVWEREAAGPSHKVYACERCNHAGEASATEADWQRAQAHTQRGLQHALAMEQVAPPGDPDRHHAEAALSVYPGRALYALITLVNKLEQLALEPRLQEAAQALLLSAFDAANALWSSPEGRSRPRQLSASQRYREANVWRSLERAVDIWAMDDPGIPVASWPQDAPPDAGNVAIFPGPLREVVSSLPDRTVNLVFAVLPRPNQAFWTLSALWAAWLWGRETAAPIRAALRRRRYDWAWHAGALRTVMSRLRSLLEAETPVLAFIPEAEPGFIAAALAGFDAAGYRLTGRAIRIAEGQGFLTWSVAGEGQALPSTVELRTSMVDSIARALKARGEPAPYALLHAAVWSELARKRQLANLWETEVGHPLIVPGEVLETALADRETFARMGRGAEMESGLYWLVDPSGASPPLADRVEELVLETLRQEVPLSTTEVDERICQALPGLLTPDQRLVLTCLRSYAVEDAREGIWRLRPEDEREARTRDCREINRLLAELGARLGFVVQFKEPLAWYSNEGLPIFEFQVMETAAFGAALAVEDIRPLTLVLPGGRAALVAEKARRDPRLRAWLQDGIRVIKFRHVRRLVGEITLSQENLLERLAIDPPEHSDPQLPLL
jgi:hypothetical protein